MLYYFGKSGKVVSPELARCLLQAQVVTCEAMAICAYLQEQHLKKSAWMLEEIEVLKQAIQVIQDLESWLQGASHGGVLTHTEAETLVHGMHHHVEVFDKRMAILQKGMGGERVYLTEDREQRKQVEKEKQ